MTIIVVPPSTSYGSMTFLQLCQRLAQETGVSSNSLTPLPTTTVGQTGELRRIVDWVARAWLDIQGGRLWNWMWEQASLTMLATTSSLPGTIPEGRYEKDSLYLPSPNGLGLFPDFLPWDEFRQVYPFVQAGAGFGAWSVAPDGSIRVDVAPAADQPFVVERYRLPTILAADDDVPEMPADLHMLIVYTALVRYADFDEAGVQRSTTIDQIRELKSQLYKRCLPQWRMGQPLGSEDF